MVVAWSHKVPEPLPRCPTVRFGRFVALSHKSVTRAPPPPARSGARDLVELAGVPRELEEREQPGALARPEPVAQLLEVAREEACGVAVPLGRFVGEPLGLGARQPDRVDERLLEARRSRPRPARGQPRRRTPSAVRSGRARDGRGRSAASGPRRRTSAPRRRSGASRRRPRRAGRGRRRGAAPSSARPRWPDSGVTATSAPPRAGVARDELDRVDGSLEETQSRGRIRSRSALRAYSIEEIGARSISPASSLALSSVGTPCTSSTSASSRWKTGAMFT